MLRKKIGLNDFQEQWSLYGKEVLSAVERVGKSGWYILGKEVQNFELNLAETCGYKYAVGCANGLDAIEMGLRVLGLKQGEKVLTTPLSAFATTLAILRAGGVPVFVDVEKSGLVDLDLCEQALKKDPSIHYFVPVLLYGQPLSQSRLNHFKQTYGLKILEDCAQAIGTKEVGDLIATSFYPTKNLGCMGDGGALLTNDPDFEIKAKCLRDYGQSQKYIHSELGLNSRLDELQAAILNDAFLPKLNEFTKKREAIAKKYLNGIKHPLIQFPVHHSVWHLFPVLIKEHIDDFQTYLNSKNIQTGRHYPLLIPHQKALQSSLIASPLEQAEYFAKHEVSLPIHPYLTEDEIEYIIETCNSWAQWTH